MVGASHESWRIDVQTVTQQLLLLFLRDQATPEVTQTGDPQKRGEVGNLPSVIQNLVVQCADEGSGGGCFFC